MENSCTAVVTELMQLAPHTEIAHHIPGRIRLKILPSGIGMALKSDLPNLVQAIPGIRNIEVKLLSQSVVIEYDKERLPYAFWEKLQQLKYKPELAAEIESVMRLNSED